jgi:hypothetical protein
MDTGGELSILRFVLPIWGLPTMRQTRSASGVGRRKQSSNLGDIEIHPPAAFRNIRLLIGIREFIAHLES